MTWKAKETMKMDCLQAALKKHEIRSAKFETNSKGNNVGATADCHVHKTETGGFVKDRSASPAGESGAAPSII
jgi:hypothetical protein